MREISGRMSRADRFFMTIGMVVFFLGGTVCGIVALMLAFSRSAKVQGVLIMILMMIAGIGMGLALRNQLKRGWYWYTPLIQILQSGKRESTKPTDSLPDCKE